MTYEDIEAICTDKALFSRVVTDVNASKEEAARIEAAFLLVFKKHVIRSCGNCVGDALAQLWRLHRTNPEQMKKQVECRYRLKAGALIRLNFGDRMVYSNENLTDEVAREYILAKPSRLNQFQQYPSSIKRRIREQARKQGDAASDAIESGSGIIAKEDEENAAEPAENGDNGQTGQE